MSNYDKNLTHALAILTTEVDESHICFKAGSLIVRGQRFNTQNDDDRAVLAILMADKEFGFSVSTVENLAKELRELQNVWFEAAENLKQDAWFAENTPKVEPDVSMTDKRALEEVEAAQAVLQRHYDAGFLLGFWHEQFDGFQYRYVEEEYARRAEVTAEMEDAA